MLPLESGGVRMKYITRFRKVFLRGFTIVELLISLGLFSVVAILIISFFINSIRVYKSARNSSELHFQAQYILNFMCEKIMSSSSISLAKPNNVSNYSLLTVRKADTDYPVKKISFKYGEGSEENYVFHVMNNSIRYGKGERDINPSVELGAYVEELYISLLKDESFGDARVIKVKIIMEKGEEKYEAFQGACMRNN